MSVGGVFFRAFATMNLLSKMIMTDEVVVLFLTKDFNSGAQKKVGKDFLKQRNSQHVRDKRNLFCKVGNEVAWF